MHRAFTDTASGSGAIAELPDDGTSAVAPPNPLRGLASDAAYITSTAPQLDGSVERAPNLGGCHGQVV
ncbi:hypothetical protein [Nonomuraea sp. NEAU-A123]|uniref:hypothetical protein n=1 Tax=Nonomuraea sp. NEAU-A123 TaxID=2839649 RepID=UPI001BE3F6FC|nr:hypothetical protein [Nonomuraea sp. NEAU-A123]MBT2228987.1 hypothetical protein [Nonomuraea sp. NEAU-A123]